MGIKIIKAEKDGVPVIMSVSSDTEKDDSPEGIVESVEWVCDNLPFCARHYFLEAAGIRMPDELNKPGTHDRVMAALRVALMNKQVLRQLTDEIVRATKEMYHGS